MYETKPPGSTRHQKTEEKQPQADSGYEIVEMKSVEVQI
jgi:hypothetical protein